MTVAVVVKVFDGIVIAADSATTLQLVNGGAQVYNGANKVFHLHRRLPVAAMTWGAGQIGDASIATLAKDFRRRLMGLDPDHADWSLDERTFSVQQVADRFVEMFHGELYSSGEGRGSLGMLIVGYSAGERQAEAWEILIEDPTVTPTPNLRLAPDQHGWLSFAQPEATERLFGGIDPGLAALLRDQLPPDQWASVVLPAIQQGERQPAIPPMPLADAVELADFLAGVTAQYSHFLLGPDTVGGVVDIAAISRHEGFRWIRRKHYYSSDLNPWGHDHDH